MITKLDRAYEIDGPKSAKTLYGDLAATYDTSFGEGWGYIAPREIAGIFKAEMGADNAPILDIGAGTGLVAEHLAGHVVDAIDITPQMLAEAEKKNIYRNLMVADLLEPLAMETGTYGGVISCGTFTHGHVGPPVCRNCCGSPNRARFLSAAVFRRSLTGWGSALRWRS